MRLRIIRCRATSAHGSRFDSTWFYPHILCDETRLILTTRFHWGDDAKQYVDEVRRTRLEAEKPSNHVGRRRSVAAAEIMRARTYVLQGERTYVHAGHLAGSTGVVMAWWQRRPPHLLPSLLCAALRLVGVINLKRQGERSGRREQRDRETR